MDRTQLQSAAANYPYLPGLLDQRLLARSFGISKGLEPENGNAGR